MPRGGRYRPIRVAMWGESRFQRLSADARLLLLNLKTGSGSNIAGINYVFIEALERETGLTPGEIRNATAELEKAHLIVAGGGVMWVKDQLKDDPARETDPNIANPKHRVAIESILGSLPRESMAVKKFREYYHFALDRVSRTPPHTASTTPSHTVGVSPEIGDRRTDNRDRRAESGKGERERENQPVCVSDLLSNNGQNHDGLLKREHAPPHWFNDCAEGRYKRACVKSEYRNQVDLFEQCSTHQRARLILESQSRG